MKILIVLHNLNGGGAEKMMVRLANGLSNLGDDVTIVLLTGGGINKCIVNKNVKLIELKASRSFTAIPKLRKFLKDNTPDRILSALTHVNVIAIITCMTINMLKKLFVSERNAFSKDKLVNNDFLIKMAYFFAPLLYRFIPNPVIAVSKGVAQDLVDSTVVKNSDVTHSPNPVLEDNFIDLNFEKPTHPWLVNKEKVVLVAVGRLAPQKGFDLLIKAMAVVKDTIDCKLIIFGDGELRSELELLIDSLGLNDTVDLPGYVEHPLNEMATADLFVLSSRFEGSPNVLVEAMSTGIKVLSTDCPHGPDEILQSGTLGYIVKPDSVDELARGILLALDSHPANTQHIIEHISRYTITNSASNYRLIFNGANI